MMVQNNQERHRTAYAVTVDYKEGEPVSRHFVRLANFPAPPGTTTGISAHDRALTARKLAHYSSVPLTADASVNGSHNGTSRSLENEASNPPSPDSFSRPGHMVPLRARPGGVLKRKGHTEAALGIFILFCNQTRVLTECCPRQIYVS
jgi:3,4-dihydroxy-2-butanone 4-phosphate synthase